MLDGSIWAPDQAAGKVAPIPCVLRSYWPTLVEKHSLDGMASLSGYERYTLGSLLVRFPQETRFAGVPFFLTHLGMLNTPLQEILHKYPCFEQVDRRDGMAPPRSAEFAANCGRYLFCKSCRRNLALLGSAWEVASATEVIARTLVRAMEIWTGDGSISSSFHDFAPESHDCGPECPQAPY